MEISLEKELERVGRFGDQRVKQSIKLASGLVAD